MKTLQYILGATCLFLLIQCTPKVAEVVQEDVKPMDPLAWRSAAPEPGPARKIQMGEYSTFDLSNGLKVIVVENNKLPRVSYQMSLNSLPVVEGKEAGFVGFTGDLMGRGTSTRKKADIDKAVDQIGASVSTFSTGAFGSSLTKHQNTMLEILSDVILNPSFPKEEFDKIKTQALSGIQSSKDDPNAIATNVASKVNYGEGHPYAEVQTEESINSIQLSSCKDYYKKHFVANNAILTIVGDISPAEAKANAEKYFGSWRQGDVPDYTYDMPSAPTGPSVAFAHKEGAVQSVVRVTYPVDIKPGSTEELHANVMNSILGGGIFLGRLMQNLREDKAFTYGARSSISSDRLVGRFSAGASVRNEVTDSSLTEIIYEMDRMVSEPISKKDLQLSKNSLAGSFARSLESPQTLARYARNIVRFDLPADHYETYLERLDKVTIADVQNIAAEYVTADNANIVVVGSRDDIASKLTQFDGDGELDYYDAFGEKLEIQDNDLPLDITPEQIIESYLTSLGGKSKLESVKTFEAHYGMSMMGMDMNVDIYQKAPNMGHMTVGNGAQVFQKQIFDGSKAFEMAMGAAPATFTEGDKYEEVKSMAQMFSHLNYLKGDYEMEVKGLDNVNGESCYKLAVTNPLGKKSTEYYSVDSGLLLRSLSVLEVPGQDPVTMTQDFNEYKEVSGIMQASKVTTSGAGPMPFTMEMKEVKINEAIDAELFQIKN